MKSKLEKEDLTTDGDDTGEFESLDRMMKQASALKKEYAKWWAQSESFMKEIREKEDTCASFGGQRGPASGPWKTGGDDCGPAVIVFSIFTFVMFSHFYFLGGPDNFANRK